MPNWRQRQRFFAGAVLSRGRAQYAHLRRVPGFARGVAGVKRARVGICVEGGAGDDCQISSPSLFERKNYYYPDLPKNYQMSQKRAPFGVNGWFEFEVDGVPRRITIVDIHLEEDAGKLVHPEEKNATNYSLVDFNRASVPLLEIVSAPEIHNITEAEAYMAAMRPLLLYLGVSEAHMEKGQIRFEANVSVRPKGATTLGKRVEIKNLNSFRTVRTRSSMKSRARRKPMTWRAVAQETRLWDEVRGITLTMRSKEESHDYRYFPEPDLVPMVFTEDYLSAAARRPAGIARGAPHALPRAVRFAGA